MNCKVCPLNIDSNCFKAEMVSKIPLHFRSVFLCNNDCANNCKGESLCSKDHFQALFIEELLDDLFGCGKHPGVMVGEAVSDERGELFDGWFVLDGVFFAEFIEALFYFLFFSFFQLEVREGIVG